MLQTRYELRSAVRVLVDASEITGLPRTKVFEIEDAVPPESGKQESPQEHNLGLHVWVC